jgi:hypothetical protein
MPLRDRLEAYRKSVAVGAAAEGSDEEGCPIVVGASLK